nr:methyltransferase domain-containing protein [Couchioplanes caeruleus]
MPHSHTHPSAHGGVIRHARGYEVLSALVFGGSRRRAYDALVRVSGAGPGDRVLDVGCGTGYLTRRTARAVGPAGSVTGIDPSTEMLSLARRLAPPTCTFTAAQDVPSLSRAATIEYGQPGIIRCSSLPRP